MEPSPPGDEYLDSPDLEPSPLAPMDVWQCRQCGHAQLRCVYDPDILYGKFSYETQVSLGLDRHFDGYASEAISVANLKPNDFVVDIGSNDGTLLSKFKSKGLKVLGIDPAKQAAESAEKRGVETWIKYFDKKMAEEILIKKGRPSLITSNNTFANIDKLKEFIDDIQYLMDEKSTFVLETGYGPAIAGKGLFETIYHEHLGYFALHDLIQLMNLKSLNLIYAEVNNSKEGCLRAYFSKKKITTIYGSEILTKEALNYSEKSWIRLDVKIKEKKKIAEKIFSKNGLANEKIGSFGASVGTSTFLLNLGLHNFVKKLYDDNPKKVGKYSPVRKIPVENLSSEKEITKVVINAWRYKQNIIDKYKMIKNINWIDIWP